ncbi:DUF350 domain-containing protein [Rhodococcus jostii]|uniref:Uncharacterized membrane protein YjfL, UPF0719 family n=1 Tax=Rhodococcus jostii TaxID=132919 RepID=A0A1H5GER0_RHOJO|nr:DUF350 domain-containing protein [Rhodococcus jostii]TQC49969.1 DUF350 domain-containing protein [Rhodococcus sp. WS4]SEE14100.1 Uncharacterized membrane protein YjfL, UPF0719 family [Rhodococcus jostii]
MNTTYTAAATEIGSVDVGLLAVGMLGTLAYFVVGVAVLGVGFAVLDLATPGNLRHQVYVDKNPNAAILLASNHLALAVVVVTAILTSSDGFAQGLADSAVYGLFGVLLQVVALRLMNVLLPGQLVGLVGNPQMCGAAWAVGASLFAIGLVNAAALT